MIMKLGELGDSIYTLQQRISEAAARVKDLESEKRAIETQLMLAMQDAGTDIVRGDIATISISETIRPQIQDYDALTRFILRRKALHLFERRISSTAYREMKDSLGGKGIPGLTEFVQARLNIRRA